MSEDEFVAFLRTAFFNQAELSLDGAIHQCMDWRHMPEMFNAGHAIYSELWGCSYPLPCGNTSGRGFRFPATDAGDVLAGRLPARC
jgi:hypothetical protein